MAAEERLAVDFTEEVEEPVPVALLPLLAVAVTVGGTKPVNAPVAEVTGDTDLVAVAPLERVPEAPLERVPEAPLERVRVPVAPPEREPEALLVLAPEGVPDAEPDAVTCSRRARPGGAPGAGGVVPIDKPAAGAAPRAGELARDEIRRSRM